MPAPFAAAEVRLGRAVAARLCNASAVFNGSGVSVFGIFNNAPRISNIGQVGMQARQPEFHTQSANVAGIVKGSTVVVTHPAATAASYTVVQRLPDELHTGWAALVLEPVA
jgi:hypothetical protein